jgi:hypothetical protein
MFETAIVGLWVPVVVFAHVFSAFWFIKTFLVYDPRPLRLFRRRRSSGVSLPKARVSEAGGETDKTVDEVLDSSCSQRGALSSSLSKICKYITLIGLDNRPVAETSAMNSKRLRGSSTKPNTH